MTSLREHIDEFMTSSKEIMFSPDYSEDEKRELFDQIHSRFLQAARELDRIDDLANALNKTKEAAGKGEAVEVKAEPVEEANQNDSDNE